MNLILHTQRLTLSPLTAEDADLVVEIFTDPEVTRFADGAVPESDILDSMSNSVKRGGDGWIGIWCVSNRATREKLGTLALLPMPVDTNTTNFELVVPGTIPDADIEVGYYLKRSAWGNGYATEACSYLVRHVLEHAHLAEVVATFDPANTASRHVLQKSGFIDHGTMHCYGATGPNFRVTKKDL